MANKKTLRNRRAMEKSNKRGIAINSDNGGKFRPHLTPDMQKQVLRIKAESRRIYG